MLEPLSVGVGMGVGVGICLITKLISYLCC